MAKKRANQSRKKIFLKSLRSIISGHDEAEEHANGLRAAQRHRARLLGLLEMIGDVAARDGDPNFEAVLKSVSSSHSQYYQDLACLILNKGKRNGFFVEFGACDGVVISNSLILEQEFGWSGILCEPGRKWHAALRRNRKCIIDERCVWSKSGQEIEFIETEDPIEGRVNTGKRAERSRTTTYSVPTVSLADLLDEHNAPERVDFLSMDVEGAEMEILKAIPFDRYRFDFCAIEHHRDQEEVAVKSFMETKGYVQVYREVSGWDGFYVPIDRLASKDR